jgi:hypothetical protein
MFTRFRTTPRRLQVSVLEARRNGRSVTNEHIASLGSIEVPMTVTARQAFWAKLWDRLTNLSNRIGPEDQAKIRNAVHARIPMVLPDEANTDEAEYWTKYSAVFVERGARKRKRASELIEQAELDEAVAGGFAENRAAALRGERPMDRVIVGKLLAPFKNSRLEGAPCVMANGEAGVVHYAKRHRDDRRRRRGGVRFTPKAETVR